MNWKKIKKQSPKAFRAWCIWRERDCKTFFDKRLGVEKMTGSELEKGFMLWATLKDFTQEKGYLYDFFDEQGIYIYLDPCSCHSPPLWNWCIIQHDKELFIAFKEHKNRLKAEQAAFTKAFELLNEKL